MVGVVFDDHIQLLIRDFESHKDHRSYMFGSAKEIFSDHNGVSKVNISRENFLGFFYMRAQGTS